GIKQVINGPFTFASDGNPLIGPIRGQRGHWVACGVMAGLSQGGGVGLAMANWMTTGDPGFDVWGMDVARYGDWTTPAYTRAKVQENYSRRFRISFPNEELPAGRPLFTSPIHGRLTDANAVWGAYYGLETAMWFQRPGEEPVEDVTFRRSNAFDVVADEVRAVREGVGMIETTGFAKHEFTGPDARAFLDRMMANRIPAEGRMALTPMLNHQGMLIGDFTVAALPTTLGDDERFLVLGSGIADGYHERWFRENLDDFGDGAIYRSLGHELTGLSIAGPASRDLLAAVAEQDVSGDAFRFLDIRPMSLGMIQALVGRITFTADLGYEIWVPASLQAGLFDMLMEAGAEHDLRLFGLNALNSMRFDKNFGGWATEYRPIYTPWEARMDRFVKLDKGDFIGREAAASSHRAGPDRLLTAFTVDVDDADVIGNEPIWHDGEVVGWVTSGGYAHWSRASCALGYVPAHLADTDTGFEIELVGTRMTATRQSEPLFDPAGTRMRS
ncbi:MAG: glycine cleavage T C-terminal barrel domain-containing protein, partial [Acidimicrobiales bacterium]|nr:glycine cleavage T C-terminal barrel domain-containing protein [Acidimicrobiales bacterium]